MNNVHRFVPLSFSLLLALGCDAADDGSARAGFGDSAAEGGHGAGTGGFDSGAGEGGEADGGFDDGGGGSRFDAGSDGPGDGGGDGGTPPPQPPPPESEEEGNFRVPRASGRFVYSASAGADLVAVIDSDNLTIDVVGVGQQPTVVEALPPGSAEEGAVAVLCRGSQELALLTTARDGNTAIELLEVTAGANRLASTEDGRWVFAYHDVDADEPLGAGSDQEITIVDRDKGKRHLISVGAHPRDVQFNQPGTIAYVTTADGISVVRMSDLGGGPKPRIVPFVPDPAIDPSTVEVQVSTTAEVALARIDGDQSLYVTALSDGALTEVPLSGFPTDVDVAADGSFAIAVVPAQDSTIVEIPLPLASASDVVETTLVEEYVGQTTLSPKGDSQLLYTTVDPSNIDNLDPRLRLTVLRRDGSGAWSDDAGLFTEVPIFAVGVAPDGLSAVLRHESDDSNPEAPWSYTLLDLSADLPLKKRQAVAAEPGQILFTPASDRVAVLLRNDSRTTRKVEIADLATFAVEGVNLGSPPDGLGYVPSTEKIYVSQEHSTGRITFIGAADVQTVTGFQLNGSVKD